MQTNDYDFDNKIRSIMEEGKEDVPPHVWESISAKLEKKSNVKVIRLRRSLIGVAVAAAIAAFGIIANHNRYNTAGQSNSNLMADGGKAPVEAQTSIQDNNTLIASAGESPLVNGMPGRAGHDGGVTGDGNVANGHNGAVTGFDEDTAKDGMPGQAGHDDEVTGNEDEREKTGTAAETVENNPEHERDPFAEMSYLENKGKRKARPSISVGGSVFTNGDAQGLSARRLSRPGTGASVTGVVQSSKESTYSIPVSLGLTVRIPLSYRWSVNTGLTYSFLERSFTGIYTEVDNGRTVRAINGDIRHTMHYLGIPVSLSYDIVKSGNVKFYTFAGGEIEKAVFNRYRISSDSGNVYYSHSVDDMQLSVLAGFGVTFMMTDHLGFYVDPGIRYYFDCDQPTSLRTQQPFMFNFELGLRFDL